MPTLVYENRRVDDTHHAVHYVEIILAVTLRGGSVASSPERLEQHTGRVMYFNIEEYTEPLVLARAL